MKRTASKTNNTWSRSLAIVIATTLLMAAIIFLVCESIRSGLHLPMIGATILAVIFGLFVDSLSSHS